VCRRPTARCSRRRLRTAAERVIVSQMPLRPFALPDLLVQAESEWLDWMALNPTGVRPAGYRQAVSGR
jgi:hypothetical protein